MGKKNFTFPMHFSKWGANLPAIMDCRQFMHSNISFAIEGCVCPKISTMYFPLTSPLLLASATIARASAESLISSSWTSKLRSRPNLAVRWHSDATSMIIESRRSPNKWADSCIVISRGKGIINLLICLPQHERQLLTQKSTEMIIF